MSDDRRNEMPSGREAADAAFAARIAAPLRAPVAIDAAFDGRVMAAVSADAAAGLGPSRDASRAAASPGPVAIHWWQRSRTVELSPLSGFAIAAGIAGIAILGSLGLGSRLGPSDRTGAVASVVHDTVQVVRFVFVDAAAARVAVVGDFNGWNAQATPLAREGAPGVWAVSLPLRSGRHEYAFVVDGGRWAADPLAIRRADEFGTESSIVTVAADAR